ncbi:MAG TPA: AAA family ATPase [Bryobacteraceae bacterium]|jgi:predicted ATPase
MIEQRLQVAIQQSEGGADGVLFLGPKVTREFVGRLYFALNGYEFALAPTVDNRLVFAREDAVFFGDYGTNYTRLGSGHPESRLKDRKDDEGVTGASRGVPSYVFESISGWVVYHFHDTSLTAAVRRQHALNDDELFRPNAENLASFLYRIKQAHPGSYAKIRDVVRLAAPFFDDFSLRPIPTKPDEIRLEWRQQGSDYPFQAHQLSDGTLRFICLATALLQPQLFRPATIIFDEPELGLHPYALTLLGNLFKQASTSAQIIVSTQSAPLLDEFTPEDIIIVERTEGESTFRRLDPAQLSEWLEDYTLGELWRKNVLGGRPREDRLLEPVSGDERS